MFKGQYFQLEEEQTTTFYKKDTVITEENIGNSIKINLRGTYLSYTVLPERPKKIIDVKLPALSKRKQSNWKPPKDHPWRKQFILNRKRKANISNLIPRSNNTNNIYK